MLAQTLFTTTLVALFTTASAAPIAPSELPSLKESRAGNSTAATGADSAAGAATDTSGAGGAVGGAADALTGILDNLGLGDLLGGGGGGGGDAAGGDAAAGSSGGALGGLTGLLGGVVKE